MQILEEMSFSKEFIDIFNSAPEYATHDSVVPEIEIEMIHEEIVTTNKYVINNVL